MTSDSASTATADIDLELLRSIAAAANLALSAALRAELAAAITAACPDASTATLRLTRRGQIAFAHVEVQKQTLGSREVLDRSHDRIVALADELVEVDLHGAYTFSLDEAHDGATRIAQQMMAAAGVEFGNSPPVDAQPQLRLVR